jgi:hypothetical protein
MLMLAGDPCPRQHRAWRGQAKVARAKRASLLPALRDSPVTAGSERGEGLPVSWSRRGCCKTVWPSLARLSWRPFGRRSDFSERAEGMDGRLPGSRASHGDLKPETTPGRRRRRESIPSGDMTRAVPRRTMRGDLNRRSLGRGHNRAPGRASQRNATTCSSPRRGRRHSSSTCSPRTCTCLSRNSRSSRSQGNPCWPRWPTGREGPAWPRSQSRT